MGKSIGKILLEKLRDLDVAAEVVYEFMDKPYKLMYKNIYDEYLIRKNSLDVAVHRALRAGWVEKLEKDGEVYLRLTVSGHERLISLSGLTQQNWDGIWRIVVFDVPEKSRGVRNLLRSNLITLGYVPWQKSVWISPLPHEKEVTKFLKENNLEENVVVLKSNELLVTDPNEFIEIINFRGLKVLGFSVKFNERRKPQPLLPLTLGSM